MPQATAQANGKSGGSAKLALPHDIDAERAVLGSILLDNSVLLDVIATLDPTDFYLPQHGTIFEGMLELYRSSEPIEPSLLIDKLRQLGRLEEAGGFLAIAGLEQYVLATGGTLHLAQVVKRKSTSRRMAKVCEEGYRLCVADSLPEEQLLDTIQQNVFSVGTSSTEAKMKHVADLWQPTMDMIESRRDGTFAAGLPLGFLDMDARFRLEQTSLTIIGARPSIGKTAFGLNVAYNIATLTHQPVGLFSMEMGEKDLTERLIARHCDIHASRLKNPKHMTAWELTKLREAEAFVRQTLNVHIDDTPRLSAMRLGAECRRFCLRHPNTAAIVIDYLGLMEIPHQHGSNRNLDLGELARSLKVMAGELGVPIIALHQLSRDVEKRSTERKAARPRLSDLRESGQLEEHANNVLFLHRERSEATAEQLDPERAVRKIVDCEVIVAKQRNGGTFTATLVFDMSTGTFRDRAETTKEVAK